MKKFFINLIAVLLMLTLVFAGCGEYKPIEPPIGGEGGGADVGGDNGGNDPVIPPEDDSEPFTVSLIYKRPDDVYVPFAQELVRDPDSVSEIEARWTDGYSTFKANFVNERKTETKIEGENEITEEVITATKASVKGLDGDYQVTLANLPKGYSYNPNVNRTTNINRNIEIEIYMPTAPSTKRNGDSVNNCIEINRTTLYSVTLESANHKVYFEFPPARGGEYSIESWVDTTANNINPKLDAYYSNAGGFTSFRGVFDDGGEENTYTKNFKYIIENAEEQVGNSFKFAIYAYAKDNQYPVTITFALKRDDEFSLPTYPSDLIKPTEDFYQAPKPNTQLKEAYDSVAGLHMLDGKNYALCDDGYYHRVVKDENGNVIEVKELLFAHISTPTLLWNFADDPQSFITVEYKGNKNLTVYFEVTNKETGKKQIVGENYKLFIEGSSAWAHDPQDRNDYVNEMSEAEAAWWASHSYYDFVNSDGLYPVTQELKDFLQKYSISQRMFNDGNGYAETSGGLSSAEKDQWLFACCYYSGYNGEDWIAAKNAA